MNDLDFEMLDVPGHQPDHAVVRFGGLRFATQLEGGLEGGTLWVVPVSTHAPTDVMMAAFNRNVRYLLGLPTAWRRAILARDVEVRLVDSIEREAQIRDALSEVL